MKCARCKVSCSKTDLSRFVSVFALPFGRVGRGKLCRACTIELGTVRGSAPNYRKALRQFNRRLNTSF